MDFLSAITAKKFGKTLTTQQIQEFAQAAAEGTVPDYQLAAMLMAIRLNGMDARETADLTMA
ncbi:MAG: pyrimidine-nucleoside phosphorylase, partial [Clostridia bacterium]|nr:pyrimidine-nucleoside phosphorylase [Clostridia bacterium]